jgi:hypothetical protein
MLGDTAGARGVLRCSPLLSRLNKGEYYRYKYAHKYVREQRPSNSKSQQVHVQPPSNSIVPQDDHGSERKGAVMGHGLA